MATESPTVFRGSLDPLRWQALSKLLDEALELDPDARVAWLEQLQERDAELAESVARLLEHGSAAPASSPVFDALLGRALQADEDPTPAETPEAELAGQRMGAWRLKSKIGEGGMGQVWLAHRVDGLYKQQAVIKLLRSDGQQALLSARFVRERAALARLNHAGIAKLLDAGVEGGRAFLVLEYVRGQLLSEHVRVACPTTASRVQLLIHVAQAVEHAHAQLVVHRDLKPANVMVTEEGATKVLDFGIAGLLDDEDPGHLTRIAGCGLTLGYAAPEQLTGAPIGVAADVFSLGVMLFEMLSGSLPFSPAGRSRTAAEYALIHSEAPRLGRVSPGAAGMPQDFARVPGDLEAIVAKALRKEPIDRYVGVGALIEDLRCWLERRPVRARREDWRHRSALWLRRNAMPASLSAGLAVAVLIGMAVGATQWQRAQSAARQSDQVTLYLTDLLGSADPDVNGGKSPNVLQLLDKSRAELGTKFKDEPETKMRLLKVLATTYESLGRYDLAAPLAEQWIALAVQRYGEDDVRTVDARIKLAQIDTPVGPWGQVIAQLEPLRPRVAKLFGPDSERMREVLYCLANGYIKASQFEAAQATLQQAGALTDKLYPPGSFDRAFHHNILSVLYADQGRLSDSLAELRKTEDVQLHPPQDALRHALALRRNTLVMLIRLGDYDHLEERAQVLVADIDQLLGTGSSMRAFLYPEMARYHADRGEFARSLADREAFLAEGSGAPLRTRTGARAALVLARALANAAPAATLAAEARDVLAEVDANRQQLGTVRAESWLALARTGLVIGDQALAAQAIGQLRSDSELNLQTNHWLDSRVAQVEGEWMRVHGDLQQSRKLLAQRVALLANSPDSAVPAAWQARIDLACTLVLLHDPGAPAALKLAAQARPGQMPAGHPLDAVLTYLWALWQSPHEKSDALRAARASVERAYGRDRSHGFSSYSALTPSLAGIF